MSIFVDRDPFPVEVDVVMKRHPTTNKAIAVKILRPNEDHPEKIRISCMATGRDFERTADGLDQVTVVSRKNNEPYIVNKAFCYYVLLTFFESWNLSDDETGEPIPITREAVADMQHSLVRALVRKWLDLTE